MERLTRLVSLLGSFLGVSTSGSALDLAQASANGPQVKSAGRLVVFCKVSLANEHACLFLYRLGQLAFMPTTATESSFDTDDVACRI